MAWFVRRRQPVVKDMARTNSDDTLVGYQKSSPWILRLLISLSYILSVVFLVLVEIGNINDRPEIRDTYFMSINVTNIVPSSVPNAELYNSLAQRIGLHDFYQVGLWGYCEGYNEQGVTSCSTPMALYWFNPVEILQSQLLAGSSIAIPGKVISTLRVIRTASHWMFALFLVGICASFLCIFFAPMAFSKQPRWNHRGRRIVFRNFPITILTFVAFLFTAAAAVVATVMFNILANVINNDAKALNIVPTLGTRMMVYEWIAVAFNLIGLLFQLGTCCGICCCSGRKKAIRRTQVIESKGVSERPQKSAANWFTFRR